MGNISTKSLFIRLLSYIEKTAYNKSDLVISLLPNAKEYMISQGLRAEKFLCIPNGIDIELLNMRKEVPDSIIKQLDTSKFVIGYAGALGIANDLYALIDAAELLKDQENIEFVLLGGGSEETKLRYYTNEKELDNIIFPGSVDRAEVHGVLEHFDVCYLGLQKSALFQYGVSPTKLYDYMAAAKPILYAIDSGNHPVKDANCGIEINTGNPKDIADAILKFYKMDIEKRRQIGINGYNMLVDNFTFDKLTEKIIKKLETL